MTYKSPFTNVMEITTPQQAYDKYVNFCDYCLKDGISQCHCPYVDSKQCEEVKQQILEDWRT